MPAETMSRFDEAKDATHFDCIGDVHGCYRELCELLRALSYAPGADGLPRPPADRLLVFVGDLTDRGDDSVGVLHLAATLVGEGVALLASGNHDDKLFRFLRGNKVKLTHGLDITAAQIAALPLVRREALTNAVLTHLAPAASHLILDGGKLVVAHAGIRAEWIGVYHGAARAHTLFGDVRGFAPVTGKPLRHDWASEYDGAPLIVYGHTPAPVIHWTTVPNGRCYAEIPFVNNTINLDTGCVFGGALTALRYEGETGERALFAVPAHRAYAAHEDLPYSQG